MSPELATIIVSVIVIFAQGVGAVINDRRFAKTNERLARIEEKLEQWENPPPFLQRRRLAGE